MPQHDHRTDLSVRSEKAILVGVILPDSVVDTADPLGELASLTKTAGAQVVGSIIQRRQSVDPSTYVGKGKAEEIHKLAHELKADVVIFDNDMSPNQLRDLEEIIHRKILDRSELILDIFATRARSHEAQLQVAVAQLEYTYPRLRHMWSHLERIGAGAGAGVGAHGPGEMQLEIDRRLVRGKVSDLKARIAAVQARKTREVEERKRQHFTISLVGYTNAGKSTLFNTLTGAETFVEDKLFATLDTKTRRWHLGGQGASGKDAKGAGGRSASGGGGGGHSALISDTVGFVRDLPHHLVASFKATLEEATHADMLLLVLDVSHPQAQQQLKTVIQTLVDIGCGGIPALLVLNKIDALKDPDPDAQPAGDMEPPSGNKDSLAFWQAVFPDALPASALAGDGIVQLTEVVREQMLGTTLRASIQVPLADSKGITFIEKFSNVTAREYPDETPAQSPAAGGKKPGTKSKKSAPKQRDPGVPVVILHADISQRIIDQLPNNVPSARILEAVPLKSGSRWRCRTKPVGELIPEGFLDPPPASEPEHKKPHRTGIAVGKHRLSAPR